MWAVAMLKVLEQLFLSVSTSPFSFLRFHKILAVIFSIFPRMKKIIKRIGIVHMGLTICSD
jgi:hypothetical protein